jgi:hypothetical protein
MNFYNVEPHVQEAPREVHVHRGEHGLADTVARKRYLQRADALSDDRHLSVEL